MSSVMKQNNQKVLSSSQTIKKRQCNCRNPAKCPLDSKCLTKNIVCKAVVSTITDSLTYYGSSEDFKFRYNNHTKAFRHQHYESDTELSKHICDLKMQEFIITSPGVLLLMLQDKDAIQKGLVSVS